MGGRTQGRGGSQQSTRAKHPTCTLPHNGAWKVGGLAHPVWGFVLQGSFLLCHSYTLRDSMYMDFFFNTQQYSILGETRPGRGRILFKTLGNI